MLLGSNDILRAWLRSLVAGLLFVGVVLMSNTFGMALMSYWASVSTSIPGRYASAVGHQLRRKIMASISCRGQIKEYHAPGEGRSNRALIDGVATAGKAVLYTAFLISASIAFWAFSPLRFQAEMGSQLLIILAMNMLGGLFLLPALIALRNPNLLHDKRPDRDVAPNRPLYSIFLFSERHKRI